METLTDTLIERVLGWQNTESKRLRKWYTDDNVGKSSVFYSSQVARINVEYEENGVNKEVVLFVKIPSKVPTYEFLKNLGLYEREVAMYSKVLPEMFALHGEHLTPKFYFVDGNDSLYLEDISKSGYKCAKCVDMMNFEQCYYIFRNIAKFHALSVKLNSQGGIPDLFKGEFFFHLDQERSDYFGSLSTVMNNLPDISKKYPEFVAAVKNIKWSTFVNEIFSKESSFNVLNHGDFLANNIMFKYDKFGIVKDTKFIDWQCSQWVSPAIDLIFFTVSSMRFDVYEKYFTLLLEIYADTLNKTLTSLGCATYPLESLVEDVEKRYAYACVILCCSLPFTFTNPDKQVDTTGLCEDDKLQMDHFAEIFKRKVYLDHVTKWFIHFAKKGVFDKK